MSLCWLQQQQPRLGVKPVSLLLTSSQFRFQLWIITTTPRYKKNTFLQSSSLHDSSSISCVALISGHEVSEDMMGFKGLTGHHFLQHVYQRAAVRGGRGNTLSIPASPPQLWLSSVIFPRDNERLETTSKRGK